MVLAWQKKGRKSLKGKEIIIKKQFLPYFRPPPPFKRKDIFTFAFPFFEVEKKREILTLTIFARYNKGKVRGRKSFCSCHCFTCQGNSQKRQFEKMGILKKEIKEENIYTIRNWDIKNKEIYSNLVDYCFKKEN